MTRYPTTIINQFGAWTVWFGQFRLGTFRTEAEARAAAERYR